MATSSKNVTAENLLSATVKYSNKDDESRVYDVSANVNINDGMVASFNNGMVRKLPIVSESENPDVEMGTEAVADFSSYSEVSLNLNIFNADMEGAKFILETIYAFMSDVRATVSANPVTA